MRTGIVNPRMDPAYLDRELALIGWLKVMMNGRRALPIDLLEVAAASERYSELFFVWYLLGVRCLEQGNWRGAKDAFSSALARDMSDCLAARAYLGRGHALHRLGDDEGAEIDFVFATAEDPSLETEVPVLNTLDQCA